VKHETTKVLLIECMRCPRKAQGSRLKLRPPANVYALHVWAAAISDDFFFNLLFYILH